MQKKSPACKYEYFSKNIFKLDVNYNRLWANTMNQQRKY